MKQAISILFSLFSIFASAQETKNPQTFEVKYSYLNSAKTLRTEFSQTLGKMTYGEAVKACSNLEAKIPSRDDYNVIIENLGGIVSPSQIDSGFGYYGSCGSRSLNVGYFSRHGSAKIPGFFDDLPVEESSYEYDYVKHISKSISYWALFIPGGSGVCHAANYFIYTEIEERMTYSNVLTSSGITVRTSQDVFLIQRPAAPTVLEVRCVRVVRKISGLLSHGLNKIA